MMRSKKTRRGALRTWLVEHPFFCLAVLAGIAFGALTLELATGGTLQVMWNFLGIGFRLATAMITHALPGLPGWLEAGLVIAFGLLPYLLADAAWQRIRPL